MLEVIVEEFIIMMEYCFKISCVNVMDNIGVISYYVNNMRCLSFWFYEVRWFSIVLDFEEYFGYFKCFVMILIYRGIIGFKWL